MIIRTLLAFTILLATVAGSAAETKPTVTGERFTGTVELYVTDWCGYCKKALSYVKANNIKYVAYDIEKDEAAAKRYRELGGRGVPLIVVGSHKMAGYSQERLEYYLNHPGN